MILKYLMKKYNIIFKKNINKKMNNNFVFENAFEIRKLLIKRKDLDIVKNEIIKLFNGFNVEFKMKRQGMQSCDFIFLNNGKEIKELMFDCHILSPYTILLKKIMTQKEEKIIVKNECLLTLYTVYLFYKFVKIKTILDNLCLTILNFTNILLDGYFIDLLSVLDETKSQDFFGIVEILD